ncbi:MAG TPA: LysR family transcriptional regulator [Burkholderiales bacterium]|jgi:DNA-binding transcriptional LysR family regulator
MDFAALQAFLAVAETGSFSRAGERIYLTQPAISKRIAALERRFDAQLFDRIGRRVQLTEAGRALLERSRSILNELDDAKRSLANLSGQIRGSLSLATSHHIGLHRIPETLKRFHARYPDVRLDLRFMDSEQACHAVVRGELELAIVTLPPAPIAQLRCERVWHDPLDVVVAPSHPLAVQRSATVRALLDHPAILPGPGTYTREIILKALGAARAKVRVDMTTNYLEVLKMLVSIGLGWTALPRTMIDGDLKVVQIKNMKTIQRELGIVTHAKRTLSNAGDAVVRMIRTAV